MNAPQIYEYILKEYNDNARKQNAIIVNQQIKQRTQKFIEKAEKIVKVKEEQKKVKKEIKQQETKAKKVVKSIKLSMGTKPFYNSEQELRDDFGGSMIDLTNYNKSHYPSNVKITMKIAKYTEISKQEYLDNENSEKYKKVQTRFNLKKYILIIHAFVI